MLLCHFLVSCLHVCTCLKLLVYICMQVSMHARPDNRPHAHPRTCAHAHCCGLAHPAERDLRLAPVLHLPLSLLISGTAEEVLQETTPNSALFQLGLHVWAISSRRLASGRSPEQEKKKAEDPDSHPLLALGSCPQWLRKKTLQRCLKRRSLWRQQPGHEPQSFV